MSTSDELDKMIASVSARLDALEAGRKEDSERISQLEKQRTRQRTVIRKLMSYCDELVGLIRQYGGEPPPAPDEVQEYIDQLGNDPKGQ